jgi:hypothetical protein
MGVKFFISSLIALLCSASQARTVTSIKITESGQSRDESAMENCRKFQPTLTQVKEFFSKAYPVEGYVLSHERYSSCYATGVLKFSDGSGGEWKLSSSGVATFTFSRGDTVTLFHRKNRWHDPFACSYGPRDEPEC